ncbi:hypothetical protein JMF97_28505 [Micromonospora fiedleri]|uniref:Secreted protein n=2 Tax=Micromonospora TaxID=1873 RepID=A0ABS1UVA4_9ACTN|nr:MULTISPECIES: hypothetical protein [Micromonospora]MBL6280109.1 hypothetical protein [Micromonospora fiedleri]GIJ18943.1 hypothetical protein Vgi01_56270 [Micromonospora gifhornensis]
MVAAVLAATTAAIPARFRCTLLCDALPWLRDRGIWWWSPRGAWWALWCQPARVMVTVTEVAVSEVHTSVGDVHERGAIGAWARKRPAVYDRRGRVGQALKGI